MAASQLPLPIDRTKLTLFVAFPSAPMIPVTVSVTGFTLFHAFVLLVIRIRLHVTFQSAQVSAIHPPVARMCTFCLFHLNSAQYLPCPREALFGARMADGATPHVVFPAFEFRVLSIRRMAQLKFDQFITNLATNTFFILSFLFVLLLVHNAVLVPRVLQSNIFQNFS